MVKDIVGLVVIFLAVMIVLVVSIYGKMEWLLDLVMRSILGMVGIYFINLFLEQLGISLGVGINIVTVLTCGILGFPGLTALYGLGIYQLL